MDGDERQRWRHGVHRWRGGIDPKPGRHKPLWPLRKPSAPRPVRDRSDVRPYIGVSLASVVTIAVVGAYFAAPLLLPNGQLQPRLPGIDQQVPTVEESAIERLQASGDPPAASRGHTRTQTPAPDLSREPDPAAAADASSSSPPAAATPPPGGETKPQGPAAMPSTACPPPLPPPAKPKKTKKGAAPEEPPGRPAAKLFILKPSAAPSGGTP